MNGFIVKFTVQKPEILIKNLGVMLIEDVKKCGNVLDSALVTSNYHCASLMFLCFFIHLALDVLWYRVIRPSICHMTQLFISHLKHTVLTQIDIHDTLLDNL